jgi:hypothetical protein
MKRLIKKKMAKLNWNIFWFFMPVLLLLNCKNDDSCRTFLWENVEEWETDSLNVNLSFCLDTNFQRLNSDPFGFRFGFCQVNHFMIFHNNTDTIGILCLSDGYFNNCPGFQPDHISGFRDAAISHKNYFWAVDTPKMIFAREVNEPNLVGAYAYFKHAQGSFVSGQFFNYTYCRGLRVSFRGSKFTIEDFQKFIKSLKFSRFH